MPDFGISVIVGIASIVLSAALSVVQMVLAPKPRAPQPLPTADESQSISRTQPINFWRFVYGETRVGLDPIYKTTSSAHKFFHWVGVAACHEVNRLGTVFIGEHPVYPGDLDSGGNVTRGRFIKPGTTSPQLRVKKLLGADDQAADSDLVSESGGEWSTDHRCRGHALVYLRYNFNPSMYPSEPNAAVVVQGRIVYDPRDGANKWSPNPALCIRDYLTTARIEGGYGCAESEIDDDNFSSAANTCEEFVAVPTTGAAACIHLMQSVDASGDTIDLQASDAAGAAQGPKLKFQTGDKVTVDASKYGLTAGTSYYVIVEQEVFSRQKDADPNDPAYPRIALASSYANALARTKVDLTADSGALTITKTGEPRWTLNGAFRTDQAPNRVLEDMLSCCGARLVKSGGKFRLMGLAWDAPTLSLAEDDLRAPMKLLTKRKRQDRFNGLKGTYLNPLNDWQSSDYPAVTATAYQIADLDERIYHEYDQPFTSRSGQAQRAAKLMLARHRFERTAEFPAKLTAYDCKAGEIVSISNDRLAWTDKSFEILSRKPAIDQEEGGAPYLGIDLSLNEADPSAFDWSSTEQQADAPIIPATLPSWTVEPTPTALTARTIATEGSGGVLVYSAILAWSVSESGGVEARGQYEVQLRRTLGRALSFDGADDYVSLANTIDLSAGGSFSLEAWFQWDGTTGADRSIFHNSQAYIYYRDSDQKLVGEIALAGGGTESVASLAALTANTWTHFSLTYDGSILTLYIDGVQQSFAGTATRLTEAGDTRVTEASDTRITEGGTVSTTTAAATIGRGKAGTSATAYWKGLIDDVRVWRGTARSATDILADFDEPLTGRETYLLHYWPMDERNSATIFDHTPRGNDGTIQNGAVQADGAMAQDWQPSWFVDGAQYSTPLPPLDYAIEHDLRIRAVNALGGVSDWAYLLAFTIGGSAGGDSTLDYGLFSDAVGTTDDYGDFVTSAGTTADYGSFV